MTKCQKVRKSWVKILTVNKIWSNYVVLVLCLESVQKWPKKQWTQYKHLCWTYGDICIRRRFKLWNRAHENGQRNSDWLLRRLRTCAQYTNKFNFTKDYERSIPLHNSVNINKYLICVHDHFWKIVMTDVGCCVIFWSKVSVAKNCLQSFEQAGCWRHSLDLTEYCTVETVLIFTTENVPDFLQRNLCHVPTLR